MKKENNKQQTFRSPGAERRYMNRKRELEKKQRHAPVGRTDWETK